MSSEWKLVGTVELLQWRIYPLDPYTAPAPLRTTVSVLPGVFPVYRKYDAIRWMMLGRINERNAKIGDGLFEFNAGDKDTGLEIWVPSHVYGVEQFAEFLTDEVCRPGPNQRLVFDVEEFS